MQLKSFAAGFALAGLISAGFALIGGATSVSADTGEDRVRWCDEMSGIVGGTGPEEIVTRNTLAIMASNIYAGPAHQWYSGNYQQARNAACQLLWVVYHPTDGK